MDMTNETQTDPRVELLDRIGDELPASIRDLWCLSDSSDGWGDNLSHWFAINDAATVMGWPSHPGYSPGCGGPDTDSWPSAEYVELAQGGRITAEDISVANEVFERADHAYRLLGDDY